MEFKFFNEDGEMIRSVNKTFDCESGAVNTASVNVADVKIVKITITKSPSWIAMKEISLF